MTLVKANCPACGEVEMAHPTVVVMLCDLPWYSYYTFRCPACRGQVTKPTDGRITQLLISAGVRSEQWHLPLEVIEHPAEAAAIAMDDVLDFVSGLKTLTPESVLAEMVV